MTMYVIGTFALGINPANAADPLTELSFLIETDRGLSPERKSEWQAVVRNYFEAGGLSFDYSRLVYGILCEAVFNDVDIYTAGRVALDSALAVEQGAPQKEVAELALFSLSMKLSPQKIRFYAQLSKQCNASGIPAYVSQEMISTAGSEKWPDKTLTVIMDGLAKAARLHLDIERTALFMLISIAQKLGSPEKIVKDALDDARKRAREKRPETRPKPSLAGKPVTIDFDAFRTSVESFLGTPYFWGGNTRRGVDCSGFTKLVMQENGYRIPRVSRDQAAAGIPIDRDEFKLGDLVFFDTKNEGRINHVGLYLGGNLMAHASSSRGVVIVLFSNRYFQSRYVCGRRIVRYAGR